MEYGIIAPEVLKLKEPEYTYKIILIGNSGVGKSSLMRKIMDYDGTSFF